MNREFKFSYLIAIIGILMVAIMALYVLVIHREPSLTERLARAEREHFAEFPGIPKFVVGIDTTHADSLLIKFYRARDFQPAWIDDRGLKDIADSLLEAIRGAADDGLNPKEYHVGTIDSLLTQFQFRLKSRAPVEVEGLFNLEILLTDAFLLYANHLLSGRLNPETIDREWLTSRPEADVVAILNDALKAGRIRQKLLSLMPQIPCYAQMRKEMVRYRSLALQGGWPMVPPGPSLKKGDRGMRVAALSARLIASGDLKQRPMASISVFDDTLEQAVKDFQQRYGLVPHGTVDPRTIAALNVPALEYFRKIVVNLERWRWLPRELGNRYIMVNIAAFALEVVENGVTVIRMPVVVGKDYRRTPVFSSKMTYLVLNPYWNVPETIATEDILKEAKRDPSYLVKRNIVVLKGWNDETPIDPFQVNWAAITKQNLPYRFRQAPGPLNALGRIKFMFPNKYDVYIHDTPSRADFQRPERALSSGCIRVQDPIELAAYVLRGNPNWTKEQIIAGLEKLTNYTITLPEPIPVHIFYCTAWIDAQGRVQFREDIYDRDKLVLEALRAEQILMD
ncbi:MAG: L,D-transpeptidase family protein [candidate division KSB1 bacterium]|nr:L,D-transpeptidase family protein [candidate division KSB1 bacterium]